MKKLNVLLLSVVALGMTVVSCSKDDKDAGAASTELKVPVGKFAYDQVTETKAGTTSAASPYNNPACTDVVNYLTFKAAGIMEDGAVGTSEDPCALTVYAGTYTQTGNVVNIVEEDGYKMTFTLVAVTSDKMTVKIFDKADATHFYTVTLNKK